MMEHKSINHVDVKNERFQIKIKQLRADISQFWILNDTVSYYASLKVKSYNK